MEIGINVRHQNGATFEEIVVGVTTAERVGFDVVSFPDHYLPTEHVRNPDGSHGLAADRSPAGPSDVWTLLPALVPHTHHIRFSTLMTSSTFRQPGPLAVAVAQVNRIAGGGRVSLGLGANWHEPEHLAFGLPFPPQGERFDRLEEQLAIIRAFWTTAPDRTFNFEGEHYTVRDAVGIPSPAAGRPRIVVGGWGLKRVPRLVATFADQANSPSRTPDDARPFFDACAAACEKIGRDPASLQRSVMITGMTIGEDQAAIDAQLAAAGVTREQVAGSPLLEPSHAVELIQEFDAMGIDLLVLSCRGSIDPANIELIGERILPKVR